MNEHEIERIAAAVNVLRPDWPTSSLRTFIASRLGSRPRRDVAVALVWVACEPATTTPARVLEIGPWWQAAAADGTTVPRHGPVPRLQPGTSPPSEWKQARDAIRQPKGDS